MYDLAMFGLVAYPALGIYKSIGSTNISQAQAKLLISRHVYGSYMATKVSIADSEASSVLHEFEQKVG